MMDFMYGVAMIALGILVGGLSLTYITWMVAFSDRFCDKMYRKALKWSLKITNELQTKIEEELYK
jgi:hypothetical protein